jgi:hypothetical protein
VLHLLGFGAAWTSIAGILGEPAEVREAVEAFQDRDFQLAEDRFTAVVEARPRHALSHAYLGRIRSDAGEFAAADSLFARALDIGGEDPTVFRHRGMNGLLWHLAIEREGADATAVDEYMPPLTIAEMSFLDALGSYDPTDLDDMEREVLGAYICVRTLAGRSEPTEAMLERAGDGWWEACTDV